MPAGVVSGALLAVNGLAYALTVVAARFLGPAGYGELAALLAVLLVGSVAGGAVQASTALTLGRVRDRDPGAVAAGVRTAHAVGVLVAVLGVGLALLAAPAVVALLHLSGPSSALLVALLVGPHVLLGGYEGICTGAGRFRAAAAGSLAFGLAKTAGTAIGLLATRSVPGALAGMAAGCALGLVVAWLVAGRPGVSADGLRAGLRAVGAATGALLGFAVLLNLDLVLARHHLPAQLAGEYAVGTVLGKIAFWLPQGIGVVLLPRLAAGRPRTALAGAVAVVAVLGAAGTVLTAVLGERVLTVVGGAGHGSLGGVAWLFPAVGTLLAITQLLVFSALADRDTGTTALVWVACAVEALVVGFVVVPSGGGPVGLLVAAAGVVAVTCAGAALRVVRRPHGGPTRSDHSSIELMST